MHGKSIFYFLLTVMVKESIETYGETIPFTVSSALEQRHNSEQNIDGARQDLKSRGEAESTTTALSNKLRVNSSISKMSKNCYHIPVYISVCPPDFTQLFYSGVNLCYIIIENQAFPPSCPYSHYLPFYQIRNVLDKYFNKQRVWINAFRNTSSGFAHFEWIENGAYYGQRIFDKISNAKEVKNKNCLVYENTSFVRVSCFKRFQTFCMYSPERLQQSNLANSCRTKGYDKCIVGDYNLEQPKCFCKRTIPSQPEKDLFCQKLAEPVFPYQTELLIKYFGLDSGKCWIGLYKSEPSEICKWASTNEDVSYTRWAKPENCGFSEGAFVFGGPPYHGWVLERDRTLKCALCEVTLYFENSSLELRYISSRDEIELSIHNVASISRVEGLGLYCFSDSNSNDFKHTLLVEQNNARNIDGRTVLKLTEVANHPSYYWCEAFEYSSKNVIRSNTILVYKRNGYGHEFSVTVSVDLQFPTDPFIENIHLAISKRISEQIKKEYDILQFLRPMRATFDETNSQMVLLIHLTTRKSSQPVDEIHERVLNILRSMSMDDTSLKIVNFLSSQVCLPDTTFTLDGTVLRWPETKIGVTAIPVNRLCLDEMHNMLPVTRKCEGDFLYGAKWADHVGSCFKNTTYSETTEKLFGLVNRDAPANDITNDLVRITQENVDNQPIDVHLVSVVLERLAAVEKEEVDYNNFSAIISNVMNFNKVSLSDAQHLLNSTDKILSSLDDFMSNERPIFIVTRKLIVQITDLRVTNVTGLALYTETPETYDFTSYKTTPLYKNTSFGSLLQNANLETAVLLPADIVEDIKEKVPRNKPARLIVLVFYNDLLFNEQENINVTQQSKTKIISVSIPGFSGSLDSPIKMAFRMPKNYSNLKNCSHWSYGLDPLMINIHGKWKTNALSQENANLVEVCDFFHTTHFGILLQNRPKEVPYDEVALEIITAIGSALSLLGIIPIFVTAILFKSWRSRPGNIILINFCIAITVQIILMFSLYGVKADGVACKIVGAGLHYVVLSEFCWMFIVALLQHRRFVMVFKPHEESIVKRCLAVGWGFPLIPVVITISVSVDNYSFNSRGFCTVEGWYYYFGYMLPIVLILGSNAFIFTKIIYSVSRQSTETCAQRSRNYKLEILLALFLFFVLGITWIFGIIGAYGDEKWSTYIFCITATLRGLVLFLFFIIGNRETRLMWKKHSTYYMEKKVRKSESTPSSNATVVSGE